MLLNQIILESTVLSQNFYSIFQHRADNQGLALEQFCSSENEYLDKNDNLRCVRWLEGRQVLDHIQRMMTKAQHLMAYRNNQVWLQIREFSENINQILGVSFFRRPRY